VAVYFLASAVASVPTSRTIDAIEARFFEFVSYRVPWSFAAIGGTAASILVLVTHW
jgi:hypothetical protein